MKIECMVLGGVSTNCYFAVNEKTDEAIVIDPADRPDFIMDKAAKEGLAIKAVFLTHGHGDHIMGVDGIKSALKVPVYASRLEAATLADTSLNLSVMLFGRACTVTPDILLDDGDAVDAAGLHFVMLSTPGHTAGGCCYYCESEGVLFSGDTLFCGSVGRTDFPGGSMPVLVRSVKEKLMTLPDGTQVFPGHGEITDIGHERVYNPYLGGF